MLASLDPLVLIVVVGVLSALYVFGLAANTYRRPAAHEALVVRSPAKTSVSMDATLVLPALMKTDVVDTSVHTLCIERSGGAGLSCKDCIRADVSVVFYLRVRRTEQAVLQVAQALGGEKARDPETLQELFEPKFVEAMKKVAKQRIFEQLYDQRRQFGQQLFEQLRDNTEAYVLQKVVVERLEPTSPDDYDPEDILDARGFERVCSKLEGANQVLTQISERKRQQAKQNYAEELEQLKSRSEHLESELASKIEKLKSELESGLESPDEIKQREKELEQLEEMKSEVETKLESSIELRIERVELELEASDEVDGEP